MCCVYEAVHDCSDTTNLFIHIKKQEKQNSELKQRAKEGKDKEEEEEEEGDASQHLKPG